MISRQVCVVFVFCFDQIVTSCALVVLDQRGFVPYVYTFIMISRPSWLTNECQIVCPSLLLPQLVPELVPLCAWDGVTCQDGTSVSSIVISESDFIGSIPPSIGQLTTLRTFDIRQNLANGAIPVEFANLPNLEIVDLSSNRLDGPVPIFQSLQLQKLILADNMLTGTLPENIGKGHPYLTDIDIIQNRLSGSLPKSLQELNSLTKLSLSENEFYGAYRKNAFVCREFVWHFAFGL